VYQQRKSRKLYTFSSTYQIAQLPLSTRVDFKNGLKKLPPSRAALSDELIFLPGRAAGDKLDSTLWSADYDNNGEIKPDRVQKGIRAEIPPIRIMTSEVSLLHRAAEQEDPGNCRIFSSGPRHSQPVLYDCYGMALSLEAQPWGKNTSSGMVSVLWMNGLTLCSPRQLLRTHR